MQKATVSVQLPVQLLPVTAVGVGCASLVLRPHPTVVPMSVGKTTFILDERPDVFVGELFAESDHGSPRHSVFDDPKKFPVHAVAPKPVMTTISWTRMQRCRERSVASSALTMAIDAGALAFIERFSLGAHFSRIAKKAGEGSCFGELVGRNSRRHDMLLRRSGE